MKRVSARHASRLFGRLLGMTAMIGTLPFTAPASAADAPFAGEAACRTLDPASVDGPLPQSDHVAVLRWFGYSSYEIAYRGHVLLFDAYYDGSRPAGSRHVGVAASDIRRAEVVLVGHPHGDHIQDAPAVSRQTGATIFVAPPGRSVLADAHVPADKVHIVAGGEAIRMPGYTIHVALAQHAVHDGDILRKWSEAMRASEPDPASLPPLRDVHFNPPNPADPNDIVSHGTLSYVVTFDDGFTVAFRDSPGNVTQGERDLVAQTRAAGHHIDVGIIGYNGAGADLTIRTTGMALAEAYRPDILLLAHHDRVGALLPDIPVLPFFEDLRDRLPQTRAYASLYRSPICVDTRTRAVYVGNDVR